MKKDFNEGRGKEKWSCLEQAEVSPRTARAMGETELLSTASTPGCLLGL